MSELDIFHNFNITLLSVCWRSLNLFYMVVSTCYLFWCFGKYEVFWTRFFCLFVFHYRLRYAYDILNDDNKRRDYDKWLHSGLCISYEGWLEKQKSGHFAMHFAASSKGPLMITEIGNLCFHCFFCFHCLLCQIQECAR